MVSPVNPDLFQAIQDKQVIVFAGTGVTAAATKVAPSSTWKGLIDHGIKYCESGVVQHEEGWENIARTLLTLDNAECWVTAAKLIRKRLNPNEISPGKYSKWLKISIGDLKAEAPEILHAIKQLGNPIVTTNYDDLISRETGLPYFTWKEQNKLHGFINGTESGVFHLHGHWEHPDSVVFDYDSYGEVRRNKLVEAFRQKTALQHILFVGYGTGLDDDHFQQWRSWMRTVLPELREAGHYILVRNNEVRQVYDHFRDDNIRPIGYGDGHEDLVPYLTRLHSPMPTVPPIATCAASESNSPRCILRLFSDELQYADLDALRDKFKKPKLRDYYFQRPAD